MFDLTTLDTDSLKGALQNATSKAMENAGNPMLLYKSKMTTNGWLLGIECIPVAGHTVVLLSASITKGWVAFDDDTNKKLGETAISIWSHERPKAEELAGLPNAKVNAQTSALVKIDELNVQAELKGSTVGMENAFNALIPDIVQRLESGHREYVNPRLQLDTDVYTHKKRGPIYIPILTFIEWCNSEGEAQQETERLTASDLV